MKQYINLKLQPGTAWFIQSQQFIWYIQATWYIKTSGYGHIVQNNSLPHGLNTEMAKGSCKCSCLRLLHMPRGQAALLRLWQCTATSLTLLSAFANRQASRLGIPTERKRSYWRVQMLHRRGKKLPGRQKKYCSERKEVSEGKPG